MENKKFITEYVVEFCTSGIPEGWSMKEWENHLKQHNYFPTTQTVVSNNTANFIGEKGWQKIYSNNFEPIKVKVLRPCMFFAEGQEITLSKLGEYFTMIAIDKLLHDGFIKYI